MKNHSVRMIREHMENIPQFPIPKGFAIRNYRPNEGYIWTRIQRAAEPYFGVGDKLFAHEFKTGSFGDGGPEFLPHYGHRRGNWNNHGVVATRYGWRSVGTNPLGSNSPRLSGTWTFQTDDVRSDGTSETVTRMLLSRHLNRRMPAIKLYLDFGFTPDLSRENSREAWTQVASVLEHPLLVQLEAETCCEK